MRATMAGFAAQRRAAEQLDVGNTIRIRGGPIVDGAAGSAF